ncbi:MAG: hypothetical protein GWP16_01310 [Nitrospirae bacterium]|nr:hypothetical protein [Nitrospirota bacterium]
MSERGGLLLGLLILAVLSLGVRSGLYRAVSPVDLTGDEVRYVRAATQLHQGEGYGVDGVRDARWPPAQSFFLSLFLRDDSSSTQDPSPKDLRSLHQAQLVLGALLALATMVLGRELFDVRTGFLAGLIAAFYPTFLGYSHYFWSETLLLVLITAAFSLAIRAARSNSPIEAILAGLLFGAAGLTREIAIVLAVGTAIWWWVSVPESDRRRARARALLMLICTAVVILPWTVRNHRLLGRFVPVSTVFWMGMREGNTVQGKDWLRPDWQELSGFRRQLASFDEEMEGVDFAKAEAVQLIRQEQPTWIFKKLARNSSLLFSPDSFVLKKISRGSYGEPALWVVRLVLVAVLLSYLGISIGGLFGIASSRGRARRLLPILVFGIIATVHILAQASSRYRLPLMPLLMVYAAAWVSRGFPVRQLGRRNLAVCALCLLILVGWCVPYFWNDALALWESGTYVEPWRP